MKTGTGKLLACGSISLVAIGLHASALEFGPFTYGVADGMATITDYASTEENVEVPAEIEGVPVVAIGASAFRDSEELISVSLPESVRSIGDYAFDGCSNLTSITLPSQLTSMGRSVFLDCVSLVSVTLPDSLSSMGRGIFWNCTALTQVELPDDLLRLEWGTFYNCLSLAEIELPSRLETIGRSAFDDCTSLAEVRLPDALKFIDDFAFSGCERLTRIHFPEDLAGLGIRVFSGCRTLVEVTVEPGNRHFSEIDGVLFDRFGLQLILYPRGRTGGYRVPDGVRVIGDFSFASTEHLNALVFPQSLEHIGEGALISCPELSSMTFLGDVPLSVGLRAFGRPASDFTFYRMPESVGFTSPTWNGEPIRIVDVEAYPQALWLLEHDIPFDTDLELDVNGDGVSLVMAYGLGLDPSLNLAGSLPSASVGVASGSGARTLSITYHAAAPGVSYAVMTTETPGDAASWTSVGVSHSALDAEGRRTSSIDASAARGFLRLMIEVTE